MVSIIYVRLSILHRMHVAYVVLFLNEDKLVDQMIMDISTLEFQGPIAICLMIYIVYLCATR